MRTAPVMAASLGLVILASALCRGQQAAVGVEPPAVGAGELARILQKLADGGELSAEDIGRLDNAVIRVDESRIIGGDPELAIPGREKKVYLLRVDRGELALGQLMEMQRSLLKSQLTVLKVLAVLALHQDILERRVARAENIQRELGLGMRDIGHGVDRARLDIASTNAEAGQMTEMNEEIQKAVDGILKIMKEYR